MSTRLVGRRADDPGHFAPVAGLHPVGREAQRIGRPDDRLRIVEVALGAVGAELGPGVAADRPHRDVEIPDQRFLLAIGRYPRPIVGRYRQVAHHAEAPRLPVAVLRLGKADVFVQRAGKIVIVERDDQALALVDQPEFGVRLAERKLQRLVDRPGRLAEHRRQPLVVERLFFLAGVGVHDHVAEAAGHRGAVDEAVGTIHPGHLVDQAFGQVLPGPAQADRALEVGNGRRLLRRGGSQPSERRNQAKEGRKSGCAHRGLHTGKASTISPGSLRRPSPAPQLF